MIHPPELLDALEALETAPIKTRAWRHMFGSHPPERENTLGSRWNPRGTSAVYLSLTKEGAIAEGDHVIAVQQLPIRARRSVYEIDVELNAACRMDSKEALESVGLDEHAISSDDHSMCQAVGGAVCWLERDGLLVPSARSDARNLVVYPENRGQQFSFEVVGQEVIVS